MSTVKVAAELSFDELLNAIEQLSLPELEQFVSRAIAVQSQKKAPRLSKNEGELLLQINQGLPPDIQQRYQELMVKRRSETLTSEEYSELLRLTDTVESLEAKRVESLAELAIHRKTSITALMEQLEQTIKTII
jgi:hypothetical protein